MGILKNSCSIESSLDLLSGYSSVIIKLNSKVIIGGRPFTFHNAKTDWSYFKVLLTTFLTNSISLKTDNDVTCAVESFNGAA